MTVVADQLGWLDFYAAVGAELPLWWVSLPAMELADLPLSQELRTHLSDWQARFDALPEELLRPDDVDEDGRRLLSRVRWELGPQWRVTSTWYDDDTQALVREIETKPESPKAEFVALPRPTQREVVRRARRRQQHPDQVVAQAAYRWAEATMAEGHTEMAFSVIVSVLLGVISRGELFDLSAATPWARRRWAKRILRLPAPNW
jgi:hypothetical protein